MREEDKDKIFRKGEVGEDESNKKKETDYCQVMKCNMEM